MRDLWKDVARRVREANRAEQTDVPFGFTEAVMRKLQAARHEGPNVLEEWVSVLKPALGLAFGTALVCILLQYRVAEESKTSTATATDAVTQTEQLIQLAFAND
jgi:hypothetical protein